MPKLTPEMYGELMEMIQEEEQFTGGQEEQVHYDSSPQLLTGPLKGNDEKGIEQMLRKQKRKYKQSLQDYIHYLRKKEQNQYDRSRQARYFNNRSKIKAMQIYQQKVQEDLQNEELSMHYKLRDEQANYMRFM